MARSLRGFEEFTVKYGTDDPRLGKLIQLLPSPLPTVSNNKFAVALLGFPYDEGVRRNNGRVGARDGPRVAREYIVKTGTIVNLEYDCDLRNLCIYDAGDIDPSLSLEQAHLQLRHRVDELITSRIIPFVIGGGNDQSYPNVRGLMDALQALQPVQTQVNVSVGTINIDAHLDVRPLNHGQTHSGSPFMQMLNDPDYMRLNGQFVEFAAQGSQCSALHVREVERHGGQVKWLKDVKKDTNAAFKEVLDNLNCSDIFLSFDLDAVCGADAPGVSCASPTGLTAQDAFDILFAAGENSKVSLCDLSEFNPTPESYHTGRLVAMMFYYFCCGLSRRL